MTFSAGFIAELNIPMISPPKVAHCLLPNCVADGVDIPSLSPRLGLWSQC